MARDFEFVPHTADIKLRVYGNTLEDLFKHALNGMFQSINPQSEYCSYQDNHTVCDSLPVTRDIGVNAPDINALLVDFLSYALYLSDVHNEAYFDAEITKLSPTYIQATVKGVSISGFSGVEIKAVTYHDLEIKQINGSWQTDIVFDI